MKRVFFERVCELGSVYYIFCHSSYSTMNSKVRDNAVVEVPEQFVTVEIHNTTAKKKMRNLRNSIIQEMKHTEDLLDQTLNRNAFHPKSKFFPSSTPSLVPNITPTAATATASPLPSCTPRNATSRSPIVRMGTEVTRKLRQLCNISQHFDQACEYRKRMMPTLQSTQLSYSLPVATPPPPISPLDTKVKEEMAEHRTLLRDWESKAKIGRQFVKRAKLKHPLRVRDNNKVEGQREQASSKPSLRSLRDIYYSQLHQERKTAPLPANNLELLCLQQRGKDKRTAVGYVSSVEVQPVLKLQKFVQGGEESSFNEFSDCIHLGEFKRTKEKFKTLEKMYEHVRQNNMFDFKDMNPDSFHTQNLLAVVYYLQNASNITEGERRTLRKRLRVIE